MADLAHSFLDALLGAGAQGGERPAADRVTAEGLHWGAGPDGSIEIQARRLELSSLQVPAQPLPMQAGRLALGDVTALLRLDGGAPRLARLHAATAELSGVQLRGHLVLPGTDAAPPAAPTRLSLGPLAAAHGKLRAEIVDAHLLFDADVTVPIRQGRVDFREATVEHVGPDSRMGASRMGIYVDAANGRSYLYQFQSAPVAGVEYERPGLLRGPFQSDRGSLRLQPFAEWLLRQPVSGSLHGLTEQARLLFARTAVSGQVQLGDGLVQVGGLEAGLVGQAHGVNLVGLRSPSVGSGLAVQVAALALRDLSIPLGPMHLRCGSVEGAVTLEVAAAQPHWRFAMELAGMKLGSLQVDLQAPGAAAPPAAAQAS